MSNTLLTTKLYIPPPCANFVLRQRLIERLNQGLAGKLSLISAPAGFGKSTLLSEWATHVGLPVAWISLDPNDNDPVRFVTYLVAALQTIDDDIGEEILTVFQSPAGLKQQNLTAVMEEFMTALINQINTLKDYSGNVSNREFALVLDDYHYITAELIHQGIAFLLDHSPPQIHLFIATRADPPLPIARLRGRGQMIEIRQEDLRFTSDEAKTFLEQVMGLDLQSDDVTMLTRSTEGWVTGLQMAAVTMQGRRQKEDIGTFIREFTGSNRYILDYLVEEVLQSQSEIIQAFLLQTSILERLTGSLCDAVIDREVESKSFALDGQMVLETLERLNLFIVPLDDKRHWYRYHRLFAELLRKRLQQVWPEQVNRLHLRASKWYEQEGFVSEAIEHSVAAADFERAVELIEKNAEVAMMRSEIGTFLGWIEKIPEDYIQTRQNLCLYQAWGLLLSGSSLDMVESRLANIHADSKHDKTLALRALLAFYRGQNNKAFELSSRAVDQLPDEDMFLRGMAIWIKSITALVDGDLSRSRESLDEVAKIGQETGNIMITVTSLSQLAGLRRRQGYLDEARQIYEKALRMAVDSQGRPLPIAGEALMGLGELYRELNLLDEAKHCLQDGIRLTRRWGEAGSFEGYISLARVKQAQGDAKAADEMIRKAEQIAVQFDATDWDDIMVANYHARLWISQGNYEAVMGWVRSRKLEEKIKTALLGENEEIDIYEYHLRRHEFLTYARLLICQKRPSEALVLLDRLLPEMGEQGRVANVIEINLLNALALHAQGELDQAVVALEKALVLAEAGGFVRIFVDEGEPMARLLYQAVEQGITRGYTQKLLSAFPEVIAQPQVGTQAVLIEPLSERERQVLQLIAEGMSNREIAQKLVLSLSTVKVHAYNIYSKLGVHSRTQAVSKASVLGILSSH